MGKGLSVYVHIPFCVRKCLYCDFLSFPAGEGEREEYVRALLREIEMEGEVYRGYRVDTVFLGGGTPSVLGIAGIGRVMEGLQKSFAFSEGAEVSMEVNPGTAREEDLASYRGEGLNRLSIGAQSFDDGELRLLGRIHRADEVCSIYDSARRAGFENINLDLMSGLPGQSAEGWMRSLERAVSLGPEHISAYGLIVEEGTWFHDCYGEDGKARRAGWPSLPSEEADREMYRLTGEYLGSRGYRRYEISNYAREGWECRHNKVYWTRGDYLGLGLGAASMVDNVRFSNTGVMSDYVNQMLRGGGKVRVERQELTVTEQMEEYMFLGLRLMDGVGIGEFGEVFGRDMFEVYGEVIRGFERQGLLRVDERVRLTARGIDVSNRVMAGFLR